MFIRVTEDEKSTKSKLVNLMNITHVDVDETKDVAMVTAIHMTGGATIPAKMDLDEFASYFAEDDDDDLEEGDCGCGSSCEC